MRTAFTLIELVFVIVVFAIISMFGADLYTKIYESYIHTRAMNQLEERTQNAVTIISSRLEERIRGTVIARIQADNTFVDVHSATANHDILEWIAQSTESRNLPGGARGVSVGWSGFADTNSPGIDSTAGAGGVARGNQVFNFISQGSNLNQVAAVIRNLRGGGAAVGNFGIIFRDIVSNTGPAGAYGFDVGANGNQFVATAQAGGAELMNVTAFPSRPDPGTGGFMYEVSEQYYLTHTAYAIVPGPVIANYAGLGAGARNFDLFLRYNYMPWTGQDYVNATNSLLVRDVSLFRFRDLSGSIALKLCLRDGGRNIDPTQLDLIVCKSQVVF